MGPAYSVMPEITWAHLLMRTTHHSAYACRFRIAALATVTKRSYYFDKRGMAAAPVSSLARHGRVRYGRKPGPR
jgi:hypothetical protein